MGVETVDTSGFRLTPEGQYTLTVSEKPEKRRTFAGDKHFRIWRFTALESEQRRKISIVYFPWDSRELLLALGGEALPGTTKVNFDYDTVKGKVIIADLVHEIDRHGVAREKLKNIQPVAIDEF